MLRPQIGTTFSEIWYRVAATRPRLSPHAQIARQHYGPQISYILEEPAGGGYYRLSEPAYFFLALLDGSITVGQAWDVCNAQLGDLAPTQRECTELLGRLQSFGLLLGDAPLAPDLLLEKKRLTRRRRLERRTGRGISFTLPIFNPEPWLDRYAHVIRAIFSPAGAAAWAALVLTALGLVVANWTRFASGENFIGFLDPANIFWMTVVFTFLRAAHELGHAAACKAFGGRVTEIGIMLIAFILPLPYCDTSSSYRFPQIRQRVIVALGGVLAESVFASIAAIIWVFGNPGIISTVCYNTMIISGVTTIIFNLNPLLRYDGYYILSDIAGSPNLTQRSKDLWRAGIQRFCFGVKGVQPPHIRDRAEAALLWIYSALAVPYRLLVLITIVLIAATAFPTVGIIIALIIFPVWFIWPLFKGLGFLFSSPVLEGRRTRAFAVVSAAAASLALLLAVVPVPAAAYASATVEPLRLAPIRAQEPGFLTAVLAEQDRSVLPGQPLFQLDSPETRSLLDATSARLERARALVDKAHAAETAERLLAEQDYLSVQDDFARISHRADSLSLSSPIAGRVITPTGDRLDLSSHIGRFFQRGALIASVIDDTLVLRAWVSDREAAAMFRTLHPGDDADPANAPRASAKVHGMAGQTFPLRFVRLVPSGSRDIPQGSSLISPAGGTILTDPEDPSGRLALLPHFLIEFRTTHPVPGLQPGLRARIRVELPDEPLLFQWTRRVRQYLRDKLG